MFGFTLAVMGGLCIYRAYDYWITGFFVPDEYGYAYDGLYGSLYGNRWFFGTVNSFIFRAFGINTVDKFAFLLPFYLFFWSGLTLYLFFQIMKALKFDGLTIALSLFSSLFLISFVLLSLGFLTEPVGLSMVMLGSLFLVKYSKASTGPTPKLLFPLFASLSFAAATYTREPYSIFLVLGVLPVLVVTYRGRGEIRSVGVIRKSILFVFPIILFVVPSLFFLQYPNNQLFNAINTVASDFFQLTSHSNPIPTAISGPNGTQVYTTIQSRLLNTGAIFLFGLVLGWGPLLVIVMTAGLSLLFAKKSYRNNETYNAALILSVLALASYLVVAFIFSPDPGYLSFRNYSTIIRFSDTALPAYFLTAPVAFSIAANKRKYRLAIVAALLIFIIVAVPLYERYSSSNVKYTSVNPFDLSYRTPAVQVREYIRSHQLERPFYLIGLPYGWLFTTGVNNLQSVKVYSAAPIPIPNVPVGLYYEHLLIPYLSPHDFIINTWTTFYIYTANDSVTNREPAAYLIPFLKPDTNGVGGATPEPYRVVSRQVVLQGSDFLLIKVQLSWDE